MKRPRFVETLQALAHQQVEFIVVGMAAGVLHGVPLTTLDIDIVHRRTPENVARLLIVLSELKATYRDDPRNLSPFGVSSFGPGASAADNDERRSRLSGLRRRRQGLRGPLGIQSRVVRWSAGRGARARVDDVTRGKATRRAPKRSCRPPFLGSHARRDRQEGLTWG